MRTAKLNPGQPQAKTSSWGMRRPIQRLQRLCRQILMRIFLSYSKPSFGSWRNNLLPRKEFTSLPSLVLWVVAEATLKKLGKSLLYYKPMNVDTALSSALDALMDDGLVYTTSDDSHFTLAT